MLSIAQRTTLGPLPVPARSYRYALVGDSCGTGRTTVATPGTAHACSCAPDDTRILEHVSHASGVFTGTAIAKRIAGDTAYYEFDVREVFTGQISDSAVVTTSTQGPACVTGYAIGTEYLVFASTDQSPGAPWSDNSCSATTTSTDTRTRQAAIEVYGPPHMPDADQRTVDLDDAGISWAWWATGLIGTALFAALAAGWHRRHPPSQ